MTGHWKTSVLSAVWILLAGLGFARADGERTNSAATGALVLGASILSVPALTSGNPFLAILRHEARNFGVPVEIADAVMWVESGYNVDAAGAAGEVGLMQVLPTTAHMLGFRGNLQDLAVPQTNIHFGVRYLARAWELAHGDLCRALTKYRAGHGEDHESALSRHYCERAQMHLARTANLLATAQVAGAAKTLLVSARARRGPLKLRGTLERSRAFWAAHEGRVRQLRARVRAKWAGVGRLAAQR